MFSRIISSIRANHVRSPILTVAAVGVLLCSIAVGLVLCCMLIVGLVDGDLTDVPFIPVVCVLVVLLAALVVLTRAAIRSSAAGSGDSA
jgi:hypothetical protein